MLSRSAAFDAALIAGAPSVVQATVSRGGVVLKTLQLQPGAQVTLDETAASRRTFQGQVADDGTLAPHAGFDPLAPFGIELSVSSGLVLPSGAQEVVPAGVFRVDVSSADSSGMISLSGPDRSAVVANARNESPFTLAASTPLDVAIATYLAAKFPGLPFVADPNAHGILLPTTPTVFGEESQNGDPWKNCQDMAAAGGRELFMDATGTARLRPIPDPSSTTPCWTYAPGSGNLATTAAHVMDTSANANVYNIAIAISQGSSTDPTIRASTEVTDPTSPIFPATFGRRPVWLASSFITTQAQAQMAANALLLRKMGTSDNTAFSAVPHPAHEPGDVVRYTSAILGVDTNVVLSQWTLRLDLLAAASYKTRRSS